MMTVRSCLLNEDVQPLRVTGTNVNRALEWDEDRFHSERAAAPRGWAPWTGLGDPMFSGAEGELIMALPHETCWLENTL